MSKFSGKCDLADIIDIYGGYDKIKEYEIYVGDLEHPLIHNCLRDLVPYYPYIEIIGYGNHETNKGTIILSKKSWVDIEEERYGHHIIYDMYRRYLAEEIKKSKGENYGN